MTASISAIQAQDNEKICSIIKSVGEEFGAIGEGYGPSDPEVNAMSLHYTRKKKSLYLVARLDGKIVGGCGVAPFNQSNHMCELKKLFLLPESRGLGLGRQLSLFCLEFAQQQGFKQCYLDTLSSMKAAIALYENIGFEHLEQPMAGTEHNACDTWMLKTL